jgi:hypothetical protein
MPAPWYPEPLSSFWDVHYLKKFWEKENVTFGDYYTAEPCIDKKNSLTFSLKHTLHRKDGIDDQLFR